jgi:hypothetical protein
MKKKFIVMLGINGFQHETPESVKEQIQKNIGYPPEGGIEVFELSTNCWSCSVGVSHNEMPALEAIRKIKDKYKEKGEFEESY